MAPTQCSECGAPLREKVTRGLCPHCLLRATLAKDLDPEVAPESSAGEVQRFGEYELLRELGRGGMGVVYEARQLSLQRVVALKMLLPARLASRQELERFQFEAEGVAALDHPNILPVYEVGRVQGQPYFTMKLAEGGSLADHLAASASPTGESYSARAAARLGATLARAVHYAHQRGIQHRDLKPGNILLDRDGRAYVSDFGLAKFRDKDSGLTLSTTVLGSPAYMSPEQAMGEAKHVTVASDVYSLGAILYELLAHRPPFQAPTALETMRQVVEQEPLPLRSVDVTIDRDLDVICLKCLHKEPAKRYASAEALAEELERWLAGEPILARPISTVERLVRWGRRRPALTAALFALLMALFVGVMGISLQWRRAEEHSRQRELERYAADMQVASQALANHDLGLARRTLAAEVPEPGQPDQRGFEWHLLAHLSKGDHTLTFTGHTATVTCAAWSADGTRAVSGGMDGQVRLWEAASGRQIRAFNYGSVVWSVQFTADDKKVVSAGMAGKVKFWNAESGAVEAEFDGQNAALSGDGQRLAVSAGSPFKYFPAPRGVTVWDWAARKILFQTNVAARRIALSPDGRWLAASGAARDIFLWNIETGQSRRLETRDCVWALAFSAAGERLAAAGFGVGARVWDLRTTNPPTILAGHQFHVWGVALSPDGKRIATTGSDRTLQVRELAAPDRAEVLVGHDDEIWSVAWSVDGERLITASKDMTVRAWSANSQRDQMRFTNSQYWVPRISASGERLLTGRLRPDRTKEVTLVKVQERNVVATFPERWAAAFAADGEDVLLLNEGAGQLEQWSAAHRAIDSVVALRGVQESLRVREFSFAPDVSALAVVSRQQVFVWRTADGELLAGPIPLANSSIPMVALSPGARQLAISLESPYSIWLHDLRSKEVRVLTNHTEAVKGMAFSPDGRWLASAGLDRFIRLWNPVNGRAQGELVRYFEEATAVAFSPDSRLLASIGHEQSVNLWHLPTRREVLSLHLPDAADRISFAPSGDALAFTVLGDKARLLRVNRRP